MIIEVNPRWNHSVDILIPTENGNPCDGYFETYGEYDTINEALDELEKLDEAGVKAAIFNLDYDVEYCCNTEPEFWTNEVQFTLWAERTGYTKS